jgi:hypothetical protein
LTRAAIVATKGHQATTVIFSGSFLSDDGGNHRDLGSDLIAAKDGRR